MNIEKSMENNVATVKLSGRLDTTTSPATEVSVMESAALCNELVMDFAGLEYISSAGLRVLLKAHKAMMGKGGMKLINVNESVMEILAITGFAKILKVE